ncbi:GMP/IMP nucleotidase YrfG [Pantoea sp. Nvir]|uniref:GMP/IMP nucleotidase n=1 Tax=Pantoea TaxID=53335 RepID=UPI000CDE3FA8|nr:MULTISPECIES: GMP/IMP nucleotidase [Pantoea]MCG7367249.1 GMP/IMP nucleotidase [Pantoea sp. ACRSH]MCG7396005.1 GMP/IMP nucleotidase [Pantoea sp. ACRSC]POW56149.1 GMP/IMP nucleotidase [Pantoea alvi]UBN54689.1 GMP/IMP nucleotidase [Pantoea agglomerans]
MTLNWAQIDTVLLDMDGTLLDLAFDRHFWLEHVPLTLSETRGITLAEAESLIAAKYQAVAHTLNWYCLDYWAAELALDIRAMTYAKRSLAAMREDTVPFLQALRRAGKRTILLTNAHPYNLDIKLAQTGLAPHLDLLLSTHTFGYPKEDPRLWQAVEQHTGFDRPRTLFIDDNETILDAAKSWGIGWCLGVSNPDSGRPDQVFQRHAAVRDYRTLCSALA